MSNTDHPDWDRVLSAAAHLQDIFPDAVLVGGTASAIYADHRLSVDADHVLTDLRSRFDDVLAQLESVAGWKTARVQRPVQILGSLDGIETGIQQLIREQPLESHRIRKSGIDITVPTLDEILRIKAVLVLKRNATRDYLDYAALTARLSDSGVIRALRPFDDLYPQANKESPLQQLSIQLGEPMPFDLDDIDLAEYKHLANEWQDWDRVDRACRASAILILDHLICERPLKPASRRARP